MKTVQRTVAVTLLAAAAAGFAGLSNAGPHGGGIGVHSMGPAAISQGVISRISRISSPSTAKKVTSHGIEGGGAPMANGIEGGGKPAAAKKVTSNGIEGGGKPATTKTVTSNGIEGGGAPILNGIEGGGAPIANGIEGGGASSAAK